MGTVSRERNGEIIYRFQSIEQLTFGELKAGDQFIAMPLPGDDHGHGGFKGVKYVFIKKEGVQDKAYADGERDNAMRISDGNLSSMPNGMPVIHIK